MSERLELLIVGGGPAGLSAARGYRDAGGQGPVSIVSDEGRMPYSRPPLTKGLLRGTMQEDELPLEDESWLADEGVALVTGRAVALDPIARRLTLSGGRALSYRCCVVSTGAEPVHLPLAGVDDPGVRVLRTLDQFRELRSRLRFDRSVAVVGSGFIGCEIAASLAMRGHAVSLVSDEALPNARRLGDEAARRIADWLRALDVTLVLGAGLDRIERRGDVLHLTAGGRHLRASLAVMAAGVAPRSELLAGTGLELSGGAVPADARMRTSVPGVLVAGDVAYALNVAAGRRLRVEHWGDALGQGTIAGATAAGATKEWRDVPGFWSTIGEHTLKYAAWGDGYDTSALQQHGDAFVVHYRRGEKLVGVLSHDDDAAYEEGRTQIAAHGPW